MGLSCRRADDTACNDSSGCSCVELPRTPGTALSCNFSDEENISDLIQFRETLPLSRRELARLLRQ